ncbi:MAG TPA: hypothetical protein VKU60_04540 [Chloroflexota bacterium]|nr:hypothetical protein [Chloroflexota bacterium]
MTSGITTRNAASWPTVQELAALRLLANLLDNAVMALSNADVSGVLETSRNINFHVGELLAMYLQLGYCPATEQTQQQRRRVLVSLGRQLLFCRALLRRWRRSLTLRRQLQEFPDGQGPYTETLR